MRNLLSDANIGDCFRDAEDDVWIRVEGGLLVCAFTERGPGFWPLDQLWTHDVDKFGPFVRFDPLTLYEEDGE